MHFHQNGYVSADPRIEEAAGYGIDRAEDLPDEVDVLIVGSGPAGIYIDEADWKYIRRRDTEKAAHNDVEASAEPA